MQNQEQELKTHRFYTNLIKNDAIFVKPQESLYKNETKKNTKMNLKLIRKED